MILLLQTAISLLSNPAVQHDAALKMQAIAFANQAIVLSQNAIAEVQPAQNIGGGFVGEAASTTIPTPPISIPVVTPSSTEPTTVIVSSCSITAHNEGTSITVDWSTNNVSSNGTLYSNYRGKVDGGVVQYDPVRTLIGTGGTETDLGKATKFKADFGGVTCYSF